MQTEILKRNFEQERKSLKLRVSELEKKLEVATRNLSAREAALSNRNTELAALQNNLKELEELREMKEVINLHLIIYYEYYFCLGAFCVLSF